MALRLERVVRRALAFDLDRFGLQFKGLPGARGQIQLTGYDQGRTVAGPGDLVIMSQFIPGEHNLEGQKKSSVIETDKTKLLLVADCTHPA